MNCSRKACGVVLTNRDHYMIHSDLSVTTFQPYCVICGRRIIRYNEQTIEADPKSFKLEYEIVRRLDKGTSG